MYIHKEHILFNLKPMSQLEAIKLVGMKMVDLNFCDIKYVYSMIDKSSETPTYIGNGIGIPHGKDSARQFVKKTGIVIAHFPKGILYDKEIVYLVIGIASNSNEHIEILQEIAINLSDQNYVNDLIQANNVNDFYNMFIRK